MLRCWRIPAALWRAIAATIGAIDEYTALLSELSAHCLLDGAAVDKGLEESIVPVVIAQGWESGGLPVDERHAAMSIHRHLYFWRLFGLLDAIRPPWRDGHPTGQNVTSLRLRGGRLPSSTSGRARRHRAAARA